MDIQKEKLTATNARRHAHGDTVNELAAMAMMVKDRVVIKCDDGVTRERLLMQCMCCGSHLMSERVVGAKWEPRYYACKNGCNSVFWKPKKKRTQGWAVFCLTYILSVFESETNNDEFESLLSSIKYLCNTVRDPHNPNNLWGEIIWGVEDDIFTVEKRIGKTPRVIAAYNLLAHVAEYMPWDHVEKTPADRVLDTLRQWYGEVRFKNHKRKHPENLLLPPVDHEAILAKSPSFSDVNPNSLKGSILEALSL